jgi:hypothetical protein
VRPAPDIVVLLYEDVASPRTSCRWQCRTRCAALGAPQYAAPCRARAMLVLRAPGGPHACGCLQPQAQRARLREHGAAGASVIAAPSPTYYAPLLTRHSLVSLACMMRERPAPQRPRRPDPMAGPAPPERPMKPRGPLAAAAAHPAPRPGPATRRAAGLPTVRPLPDAHPSVSCNRGCTRATLC